MSPGVRAPISPCRSKTGAAALPHGLQRLQEGERSPARGVLATVVGLHDLEIEAGTDVPRLLSHQGYQRVDAQAHVRCLKDRDLLRGSVEGRMVARLEAGGTDYDHEARACGDLQMSEERIRGREVEDDIHVLGRGSEVRGHRPAVEVAAVARVARSLPEGAVADARGRLHRLQ